MAGYLLFLNHISHGPLKVQFLLPDQEELIANEQLSQHPCKRDHIQNILLAAYSKIGEINIIVGFYLTV